MNNILKLENISQTFGKGSAALTILKDIYFEINRGEIIGLAAPSGAGKSTLLHIAALLERPSAGEISVFGRPTSKMSDASRTNLRRDSIGFVYQFHHLLPEFTAVENVMMPQMIAKTPRKKAYERSMELLEMVKLGERSTHRPSELSGGEQQRVAIVRALANNPSLLLADEPTGNLDERSSHLVFDLLLKIMRQQEMGALIATHNIDLARKMDRVITIKDQKLFVWKG